MILGKISISNGNERYFLIKESFISKKMILNKFVKPNFLIKDFCCVLQNNYSVIITAIVFIITKNNQCILRI